MLEPDSIWLVVLLLLFAVGAIVAGFRYRHLAIRIAGATLAILLAATSGIAIVNDYYGYYQTWTQLSNDLTGSYSQFASAHVNRKSGPVGKGRLVSVVLPGRTSGITRRGYVYLPPQYFQHKFAKTRFPTVELMHGSPGTPNNWLVQIDIAAVMNKLIAKHLIGPMIVVLPAMNDGSHFQECVDAPGARDDTYISVDVPADVRARFRSSTDPAQWGISGYSSGGYCAANLALRHRDRYGAAAIMDGYFRPVDGPAAAALHNDPAAEAQNDPLAIAQHLGAGTSPLPSLWLSAGTGNARDAKGARAFVAALHGVEAVTLVNEPGAGHNYYAWRPVVPRVLAWMWTQIAPPSLRVQFPVAGAVTNQDVVAGRPPTSSRSR